MSDHSESSTPETPQRPVKTSPSCRIIKLERSRSLHPSNMDTWIRLLNDLKSENESLYQLVDRTLDDAKNTP